MASLVIPEAAIDDGGEYRAVVTNIFGSAVSNAFISVISKDTENMPAFVTGLYNRSVEIDNPIKFEVIVTGTPQPTLKWLHNGKELDKSSNAISIKQDQDGNCTFSIYNVSTNDAGEWRAIARNLHGTATTNAILTVLSKPKIIDGLKDCDIVEGSPIKLQVRITAYPSPDIKWCLNGNEIPPDDRFAKISHADGLYSLEIPKASISDSGEFSIVASNELGADTSKALVSVSTKSDVILQHGEKPDFEECLEDEEVDIGSTAEFEVLATGVPKPSLKWLHNGKEIVPEKGRIHITESPDGSVKLTICEATFADAGSVRVIATNESGTAVSDATLSVQSKPIFVTNLKDKYLIEGDTAKFEATIDGFPTPQVEWLYNDEPIEPQQSIKIEQGNNGKHILSIENVSPEDIGRYKIVATNKYGKASSDANLFVSPSTNDSSSRAEKPSFTKELEDLQIDEGFPVKFEVKVTGNPELKWYRNDEEIHSQPGIARISQNPDGSAYLILHEVSNSDKGIFKVIAENEHGKAECSGVLSVSAKPIDDKNYDKLLAAQNDSDTPGILTLLILL